MSMDWSSEDVVREVWAALAELGFDRTQEHHDEGLHRDLRRVRVLVGYSSGGVRIRLQRSSQVQPGRWVDMLTVDIPGFSYIPERVDMVRDRLYEYINSVAPIESAGDAATPRAPRNVTMTEGTDRWS